MSYPKQGQEKGGDPNYPPSQMPGYPPQYQQTTGSPPQYQQTTGSPPQYQQTADAPPPYSTNMYGHGQHPVQMYPHQQQYTFAQAQAPPHSYPSQLPGPPMPGPPPNAYAYQMPHHQNPGYPVQQNAPQGYPAQATAQFDSGARFDGIAGQNIPPPPPGIAPNAAQMAAAQGGTVYATQKKSNWLTGGKGGGMSFW